MPSLRMLFIILRRKSFICAWKSINAGGVAVSGLKWHKTHCGTVGQEMVDNRLQNIMEDIHRSCLTYGKEGDFTNYVKGANIAGFVKVADAMLAQGGITVFMLVQRKPCTAHD